MHHKTKYIYILILCISTGPALARASAAIGGLEQTIGRALPRATRDLLEAELARVPNGLRQEISFKKGDSGQPLHVLPCIGAQASALISYQGVVCYDVANRHPYLLQVVGARVPFLTMGLTAGLLWLRVPAEQGLEGYYTGMGGTVIAPRIICAKGSSLEPKALMHVSPLNWDALALEGRSLIYTGLAAGAEFSIGAVYVNMERL